MRARRLAALAALLAIVGAVAWLLLRDGSDGDEPAAQRGAKVASLEVASEATGAKRNVSVAVPAGTPDEGAALLVFLHGRDGDSDSELDNQVLFDTLDELGERAPIVAFPDGGDSSYWHDRDTGDWGEYVLDEVIPRVTERFAIDADRVAIGGISMGGFGALDLARQAPGRFCAVGAHSPAIWQSAGETAAGAFDDADDFAAHDLITVAAADPALFAAQPLRLDIGDADPFLPGFEAFVAAVEAGGETPVARVGSGGHDDAYWGEHWDEYVRFYARELDRCEG